MTVWSNAVVQWMVAALSIVVQVEHGPAKVNEYEPAAQGVHVVAPALVPVFVMEPAAHV